MITLATCAAAGDDEGGLPPGVTAMDTDEESLTSFLTGSTTIIEEESDSEEDSGGEGSSFQAQTGPEKVTMMGGNARPIQTRNGKRTLVAAIYLVLQDAGERLRVKEILGLIRAKKLYVFKRKGGSVCSDPKRMMDTVRTTCSKSPFFVRSARGTYGIAKEYANTQDALSTLNDAIYRVLQDAGGSLQVKEILAKIRAKKLHVFKRKDGSLSTDPKRMRETVRYSCRQSPLFVRTAYGRYAIAKESLKGSNTQDAAKPSPLREAIYRVLQGAGGSLHYKEIHAKIQAKKLYVFRRLNGSVSTDLKKMWSSVRSACRHSPFFVRTEPGTYAIAKEYLNGSTKAVPSIFKVKQEE
ncbi:hypothetical protein A3770_05p39680 [Chloropicon primus]|uniref:HTH HARE-type domain-containing protein n=1 Tax=Chloropicon primus TaxID=1764295 RepID=A0A5B8MPZ6_9CHLO|nr:hypothetical protein A3770_05p39680 [Chloropicon primus]|eukprot:QDZ21450.1 hypothetical protein A3770_05p39680 [Chloropicon primus]